MMRVAWAITGGGHFLPECVASLTALPEVDVFLSRAAEEVIRMYRLRSALEESTHQLYLESRSKAGAPQVARFSRGDYRALIVAPATGNSVAKFVYGIADSLATNLFAQAGKSLVPTIVLPTDIAPEIDSPGPKGGLIKVYPRQVDLENVSRLRAQCNVTVVDSPAALDEALRRYL